MIKKFVCLAKSVRDGGFCIAGKEICGNGVIGNWFRPIGISEEALPTADCTFNIGNIVACEVNTHAPSPTQPENYTIASRPNWNILCSFPKQCMDCLVDAPSSLWTTGSDCSSRHGKNDRVSPASISAENHSSLYFIRLEGGTVIKKDQSNEESSNNKIRLEFLYNNECYSLVVTDPALSGLYWDRLNTGESIRIGPCYITVSLGKPFHDYCYKLVAGYVKI